MNFCDSRKKFEVASYTALIRAAQELNDQQTAAVCQQILLEDEEMVRWLQQNLPMLVQQTLQKVTSQRTV